MAIQLAESIPAKLMDIQLTQPIHVPLTLLHSDLSAKGLTLLHSVLSAKGRMDIRE